MSGYRMESLRQPDQGIVGGSVAVWVEFAQYIADNAGAFYVWPIPNVIH